MNDIRIVEDEVNATLRAFRHGGHQVAEAVLALAAEWEADAVALYEAAGRAAGKAEAMRTMMSARAKAKEECAGALRASLSSTTCLAP